MLSLREGKLVIVLLTALGLSACQSTSTTNPPVETVKQEVKPIVYVAQEGLTAKQRFSKALEYLENGQEGQAKVELQSYLASIPDSKSAKDLLTQIEMDPKTFFPQESFAVVLKSGESLSTLSKNYLGSALKFYALAKYNQISNPSRVNIGQTINIPLTAIASKKRQLESQGDVASKADVSPIGDTDPKPDKASTVKTSESSNKDQVASNNKKAAVLTSAAPVETAETVLASLLKALEAKDFVVAQQQVEKLQGFGEISKQARPLVIKTLTGDAARLSALNKPLAANRYAQIAQLNLQDNDNLAAFDHLKKASLLDPANVQVSEDMLVLQKDLSDKYHREASSAYRRQELDLAIEKWNKVLEIDPQHSSAKLYRAQAIELKERLKKLNN